MAKADDWAVLFSLKYPHVIVKVNLTTTTPNSPAFDFQIECEGGARDFKQMTSSDVTAFNAYLKSCGLRDPSGVAFDLWVIGPPVDTTERAKQTLSEMLLHDENLDPILKRNLGFATPATHSANDPSPTVKTSADCGCRFKPLVKPLEDFKVTGFSGQVENDDFIVQPPGTHPPNDPGNDFGFTDGKVFKVEGQSNRGDFSVKTSSDEYTQNLSPGNTPVPSATGPAYFYVKALEVDKLECNANVFVDKKVTKAPDGKFEGTYVGGDLGIQKNYWDKGLYLGAIADQKRWHTLNNYAQNYSVPSGQKDSTDMFCRARVGNSQMILGGYCRCDVNAGVTASTAGVKASSIDQLVSFQFVPKLDPVQEPIKVYLSNSTYGNRSCDTRIGIETGGTLPLSSTCSVNIVGGVYKPVANASDPSGTGGLPLPKMTDSDLIFTLLLGIRYSY